MSYDYSYDANGNITEIKQNGKLINKYTYDSLNELKEEYDYVNKFYINYSYDGAGNLQNKYEQVREPNYGYPTGTQHGNTYEYTDTSWKDKLTKVNGSNISYDANGNPLTYRDGMSFEWENGRVLKKINTSDKSVQMSYDSNGMRTQKSVDGVKTNYYYDSSNNLFALTQGNDTLFFYYDNSGEVMSVSCNGTMYFYIKDLQGDITEIVDKDGKAVAKYAYDAWGNMLTENNGTLTVGKLNPFRYRSYVYDEETGLYYLQSRYYDPLTGRFVNADIYCDTETDTPLSTNMFAYCENNAINNVDFTGEWFYNFNQYYNYYNKKYTGRTLISFKSNYKKLVNRYKSNCKVYRSAYKNHPKNDYIFDQTNAPYSSMVYGTSYSKISRVGCKLIAIYNTLKYIAKGQSFVQVIAEAEMNGLPWLNGRFGTKPENIAKYLNAHKISYKKYTDVKKFKAKIKSSQIVIVSVWNNGFCSGLHTYCVYCNKGNYFALNFSTSARGPVKGPVKFDLSSIKKEKFIIGYCF